MAVTTSTQNSTNQENVPNQTSSEESPVVNQAKKVLSCALWALVGFAVVGALSTPLGWAALGAGIAVWIIGFAVIQPGAVFLINKIQDCLYKHNSELF